MRSPIKWAGGKSRMRKRIIEILPDHSCYLEPFCGAAWVLFGKEPSPVEIINDIDGDLINFFQVVKDHPQEFIDAFDLELVSRERFEALANLDSKNMDKIARAHRFYYLIMAGWGGELNYPRFQTSIRDGGHGNRLVGAIKTLRQRIDPVHKRLQTVLIENLDWRDCIKKYDREGVVMYIDPPYPGNGVNYAHNMREWIEHEKLAAILLTSKAKWVLSSYDNPEVRKLFRQYNIIPVKTSTGLRKSKNDNNRVVVDEVLVMNYEPTIESKSDQTVLF